MLLFLRRLSKPIRVLLLLIPVFLCIACLVAWELIEAHDSETRSAWAMLNIGETVILKQKLQDRKIDQEDLNQMLWWEAQQPDTERSVRILLELGVNTNTKDSEGHTALQIARNHGNWKIARLLHQAEAKE